MIESIVLRWYLSEQSEESLHFDGDFSLTCPQLRFVSFNITKSCN